MEAKRWRARLRETPWILGGLAVLLFLSLAIFVYILRGKDLPSELIANRVLLYFLWNLDAVLILTILMVLTRNLIKLMVERQRRILGARLRTKIVATYIGLALGPVLLLFFYGASLIEVQSERLFAAPVRDVLAQGNALAGAMQGEIERGVERDAGRVLRSIEGLSLVAASERPQLERRLRAALTDSDLDFAAVYEGTDFVHAVVDPQSGLTDLPEADRGLLREALARGHATRPSARIGGGHMTFGAAADVGPGATAAPSRGVVVVGRLLDAEATAQTERLIQAYQQFRQLEVQRADLKASDLLLFLLVTLLILLGASWLGFYLSRRVTAPIQALAAATERISTGDLSHRVEVEADDELRRLVGSFNAMTEEVARGRGLLEGVNRELAAVLESIAAGVISIDGSGRIAVCNQAAQVMLRQDESEVMGRTPAEAWGGNGDRPDRSRLVALLDELGPRGGTRQIQLRLGDTTKTLEVKVAPLPSTGGDAGGLVVVLEDLTELIKAQQLATWSEAARRVAHEIKNPLTPIQLAAERMLQRARASGGAPVDPALAATLEEGVATIQREVTSMNRMVDEFSRFARMPRPVVSEVDVEEMIGEAVHLYRDLKPGVRIDGQVEPDAKRGWFDREQIKRALLNLLDNAVEATPAPGAVRLRVDRRDEGAIVFAVADSGRGIPAEARTKLFLPHFSTKGRGSGLGLAIVHRIAADHGGTVAVADNHPTGSVFTIELPQ